MLTRVRKQRAGFTLVELMVTLALMAVLAVLAVPSLRLYSINARILGTAEAFYAAVQVARAEAIRRNLPVELVLTAAVPTAASVGTTTLDNAGPNWIIRAPALTSSDSNTFIDGFQGNATGGMTIAGASSTIRFDAMGARTAGGAVDFTHAHETCAGSAGGAARCLRVTVAAGGEVRLCDPAVDGTGDTRRCP